MMYLIETQVAALAVVLRHSFRKTLCHTVTYWEPKWLLHHNMRSGTKLCLFFLCGSMSYHRGSHGHSAQYRVWATCKVILYDKLYPISSHVILYLNLILINLIVIDRVSVWRLELIILQWGVRRAEIDVLLLQKI